LLLEHLDTSFRLHLLQSEFLFFFLEKLLLHKHVLALLLVHLLRRFQLLLHKTLLLSLPDFELFPLFFKCSFFHSKTFLIFFFPPLALLFQIFNQFLLLPSAFLFLDLLLLLLLLDAFVLSLLHLCKCNVPLDRVPVFFAVLVVRALN
jgi:hypothetical protein